MSSELLQASERIYYRNILWYYCSGLNILTRYFHHGYSCNFGTGILVLKSSFPNLPSLLFLKTTRLLLNMNVYINLICLLYLSTDQVISTNDTPHWNICFFVGLFLCVYRAVNVYFSSPIGGHNATFVYHMQCLFQDVWPLLP